MSISVEFQTRFKELVEEENQKKKSVAEQMGIAYVTFSKIYNYGIVPRTQILIRIADFFNVSIEYLLGKTDSEYFSKSDSPKTFCERLEELRQSKGLTVYSLSGRTHIHKSNILQWRKKDYIPSINDLEILADFFDVSIDYLLGRTDDDTPYRD